MPAIGGIRDLVVRLQNPTIQSSATLGFHPNALQASNKTGTPFRAQIVPTKRNLMGRALQAELWSISGGLNLAQSTPYGLMRTLRESTPSSTSVSRTKSL